MGDNSVEESCSKFKLAHFSKNFPPIRKRFIFHNFKKIFHYYFRQLCNEVTLMKGFRYEITVYYYGNGLNPDFFRLGVRFPDNTEVKPISKIYLKRSMGRYIRTDVKSE